MERLVVETVDMLRDDPLARDVRLEVDPGEGTRSVSLDPDQLRQVLLNLARNALQATGPQGRVRVELRHAGGDVVLKVWNAGAPIPRADVSRLFEPFFTTREGGTGLGLATAHSIVRAHGGDIRVHSEEGTGTEFVVVLPLLDVGGQGPFPEEPVASRAAGGEQAGG
jgi:two-component system sensor histidine kinase PilS (NtrC family)